MEKTTLASAIRFGQIETDGEEIYWAEMNPVDGGRVVIRKNGTNLLPAPWSARSKVHEYGGGAFRVAKGRFVFTNGQDQKLYSDSFDLIAEGKRFADMALDGRYLFAVGEEGTKNTLEWVGHGTVMKEHDFYSSPTLSPDGTQVAFLAWHAPQMPWDGTELWIADLPFKNPRKIAGGPHESIYQPQYAPDGTLFYISDKTGFWNLYANGKNICPMPADFGIAQWILGTSRYAFFRDKIAAIYTEKGEDKLALIDPKTGKLTPIPTPFASIENLRSTPTRLVFHATYTDRPSEIVTWDGSKFSPLATAQKLSEQPLSTPEHMSFETCSGFYYPPIGNQESPPLIVKIHGGPTTHTTAAFDLKTHFWPQNGFAYLDLNYRGSTGNGRAFREALYGNWGVYDVEDACLAAKALSNELGSKRCIIRGSSAGGYTTLAALTFKDTFDMGASYYGISDLSALAKTTHKFEASYNEKLLHGKEKERSPIHFANQITSPIIFFQGSEDRVVPPNQSEMLVKALQEKNIRTKYHLFDGEGHGFRKAKTHLTCLEEELSFYNFT